MPCSVAGDCARRNAIKRADVSIAQRMIPLGVERGALGFPCLFAAPPLVHSTTTYNLWLAEFKDPHGNRLALMSEVPR
jgi:hypothetical protein